MKYNKNTTILKPFEKAKTSRSIANMKDKKIIKKKVLLIISGGSGVGKTTVANLLIQDKRIERIITSTTRECRLGEEYGKDYYFVTKEAFEKEINKGNFIEYTEYDGNYYGIHGPVVEMVLKNKKKHGIVVVDVKGANFLKEYCSTNNYPTLFFWLETNTIRFQVENMRKRNTSDKEIIERLIIQQEEWRNAKLSRKVLGWPRIIDTEELGLDGAVAKIKDRLEKLEEILE